MGFPVITDIAIIKSLYHCSVETTREDLGVNIWEREHLTVEEEGVPSLETTVTNLIEVTSMIKMK